MLMQQARYTPGRAPQLEASVALLCCEGIEEGVSSLTPVSVYLCGVPAVTLSSVQASHDFP